MMAVTDYGTRNESSPGRSRGKDGDSKGRGKEGKGGKTSAKKCFTCGKTGHEAKD